MSSCKLCKSLVANTKLEYNDALSKEHAQRHYQQLSIFDGGITLDQIVEQCFPKDRNLEIGTYRKSSKYKVLAQVCRSLFPQKPPSQSKRTALCKKCYLEKIIYRADQPFPLDTPKIIDHACIHLRLDLYKCPECDRRFSSRGGIKGHLANIHRINVSFTRLDTKLDDFIDEISNMIKECFSDGQVDPLVVRLPRTPRVSDGLKLSDLGAKRQAFCRQLVKKVCDPNGNVQCRLCEKEIKVTHARKCNSNDLLQHAFRHLQKPVVRCKICSDDFSNSAILASHLRKIHAATTVNNYERREDHFHDDIMAMLRKCYLDMIDRTPTSSSAKAEARTDCKTTRGSDLQIQRRMFCYTLCRKFANPNGELKCRVCGNHFMAKDTKGSYKSEHVLSHALTHLNHSALNRCKICSKTFLTRSCMSQHLKVTHALPLANNYEYLADQYHHEILAVLRKCYGDKTNTESAVNYTREPRLRKPVNGTNLTIERQQLCLRLVKKFLHRDGKMHCRICSKKVCTAGGHSTDMVKEHVLAHTDKHSVRCKHCKKTFVTMSQVRVHLKKVHGMAGDESHYESLQDQFHSEIVDMIRKCFDETETVAK